MRDPHSSRVVHRRLLGLLLVGSMALYAFPAWWGLPGAGRKGRTWAFDEIIASNPGESVKARHGGRYPPLHYSVLRVVHSPLRALERHGAIDLDKKELHAWLQLLGRLLSVLMATASVYWVYRSGRLLFDRSSALFAAAVWAFVTPLAFFAKTVNLDVPYIFWFALSVMLFLRVLAKHRLTDYLGFAISGALAMTTKDQAYALYLMPALALIPDLAGHLESPVSRLGRLGRALLDRRIVLGLAAAVAVFVVVHHLIFDWAGFVQHVRVISGTGSEPGNTFPRTVGGHLAMAALAVDHLAFSMSWPLLILAVFGTAMAIGNRAGNRALPMLLLFPASYYLSFISVIHYHRIRFFLPVCLILALMAARASRSAWQPGPQRRWQRLGLIVMLGFALAQSLSLDLRMQFDSRYKAEEWIGQREMAGESVWMVGDYSQVMPRSDRRMVSVAAILGHGKRNLSALNADYLLLNESALTSTEAKAFLENPQVGGLKYAVDRRFPRRPSWDLIDMEGLATNLDSISPDLIVLHRVDLGLPIDEMERRAGALFDGGSPTEWSDLSQAIRDAEGLAARDVGPGAQGYGLGRHGTARGGHPAALLVSAHPARELVPRLMFRCVWDRDGCPEAVEIATLRARYRVALSPDGELAQISLDPMAPGSEELVLVVSVPSPGQDPADLGPVRVRVGGARPPL